MHRHVILESGRPKACDDKFCQVVLEAFRIEMKTQNRPCSDEGVVHKENFGKQGIDVTIELNAMIGPT